MTIYDETTRMDGKMNIGIIIVAGGSGKRMGGGIPKQFRIAGNEPLLVRTINTFATTLPAAEIVVVLPSEHTAFWNNLKSRFTVARHKTVAGGAERFHSVKAGIAALGDSVKLIAVHDGVRALCSRKLIIRAVQCALEHGSAVPAIVPTDSFRAIDGDTTHILDRSALRMIQTPQIFDAAMLRTAYDTEYDPAFTDDASVVERAGGKVVLCEGERSNIKITTPEDIAIAEALLDYQNDTATFAADTGDENIQI